VCTPTSCADDSGACKQCAGAVPCPTPTPAPYHCP
jgi:hypothetical protein